ncbi:enoyl-CoA hydratase [Acidovorax carolinensis]|uniref:Enoyl-CoA hydratase n=1 Tax=Acidovorax carolinensis TaxID=553814 RepID=A0A240U8P1_9BURK|nr:enoyl-CoA hydratase-related protein [Acidovorax carolinensis]ART56550.1 enoyl-CoA hydratase [Acidovorax carolinensis]ART57486.1 enoyl-CoA hydratase [Acidovorax carolinensis]
MTASTEPPLQLERAGAIATLRFNRPGALNAIDVPMATALLAAVRAIASDDGVRCVVLRGAGKGFMAGGDLATLRADPVQGAKDLLTPLNEAVALLAQLNAPVVAQVHGVAAGAGLSLMLQADFVLAAEGTRFNLAYINLGTSCDVGASWALPRLVGLRRALEIAMLGDTYTAQDAERLGLVNRVVPAAELDAAVQQLAQRLASGPTQAYGHMRRLMRASFDHDLPTQLAAEGEAFVACARSADLPEGIEAFHAKRPAVFQGR